MSDPSSEEPKAASNSSRTWAKWRDDLEARGLLQPQSPQSRARRSSQVSPLVPLELLDEFEISVDWDRGLEKYVARCPQVAFVWWPHDTSQDHAVMALAMYLQSLFVGLSSDLCIVPGVLAKSDAEEQRWHLNEAEARETFLATLKASSEGEPA